MSRPKPQVLIENTNKQTYKTEQVLASEGVWAVFYDSKPINLKTSNMLTQYPGPKYKKYLFQIQDMLSIWLANSTPSSKQTSSLWYY